jgi:hypothetical protein
VDTGVHLADLFPGLYYSNRKASSKTYVCASPDARCDDPWTDNRTSIPQPLPPESERLTFISQSCYFRSPAHQLPSE